MTETTLILVFDCRLFEQHVTQADLVKKKTDILEVTLLILGLYFCASSSVINLLLCFQLYITNYSALYYV